MRWITLAGVLFTLAPAWANHAEVDFRIRLKDGQSLFRQGETIALELVFTANVPEKYQLSTRTYDRGGRQGLDRLELEPNDATRDPMADYFGGPAGFVGGGLGGIRVLGEEPDAVTVELNEWFRFDRTGRYGLRVFTTRVAEEAKPWVPHEASLRLASNQIFFEVVAADDAWTAAKLREAVAVLDSDSDADEDSKRRAARTLRFLGTEKAAIQMVRLLSTADQAYTHDLHFGLIGSPHRELVRTLLDAGLDDPDRAIDTQYLGTLAVLALAEKIPLETQPDGDAVEAWRRARSEASRDLRREYEKRLIAALPRKRGPALATSLVTLLREGDDQEQLRAQLAGVFQHLPPNTQQSLLEYGWKRIRHEQLRPVLREIYESAGEGQSRLRGAALRRLYELAPEVGRELVLGEMRRETPGVPAEALPILGDEVLPELDAPLLARLKSEIPGARDNAAELLARYGSPAILDPVREFYDPREGKLPCRPQAALLAYLLRVEPEEGLARVRSTIRRRGEPYSDCYPTLLEQVTKIREEPALEPVAVELLRDPDPQVVSAAAAWLGQHGSADAEAALWKRLEEWSGAWRGREQELVEAYDDVGWPTWEGRIEDALRQALLISINWRIDEVKSSRLAQLCVTLQCRQQYQ